MAIGDELDAAARRRFAHTEPDRRAALRALAIAQALDGTRLAAAARGVGRARQALRAAVVRDNAEGLAGLHDRARLRRRETLDAGCWAAGGTAGLGAARGGAGGGGDQQRPPARHRRPHRGVLGCLLHAVCAVAAAAAHGAVLAESQARAGQGQHRSARAISKPSPPRWPRPPPPILARCSRSGATQKGRTGHRWFTRGEPPPGRCGKRFLSTDLVAAVRPGSDDAFALALLLDQAGWHGTAALRVPDNVTLLPLPSYSPELNPVERVWLYLRERVLSFRLYQDEQAIVDALCAAWNALRAETGRLTTLTSYPWIIRALDQLSNRVNEYNSQERS